MKARFTDWSALNGFKAEPPAAASPKPERPAREEPVPGLLAEIMGASRKAPGRVGAVLPAAGASAAEEEAAALKEALDEVAADAVRLQREGEELARERDGLRDRAEADSAARRSAEAALAEARLELDRVKGELAAVQRAESEFKSRVESAAAAELERCRAQLEAERMRGGSVMALMDRPDEFREVFPGEVREHVLAALREALDAAAAGGRERRERVLEAVLAANASTGELERRRTEVVQALKDAGRFVDDGTISRLERLGFRYVAGNRHHKLEFAGIKFPVAKTPSDHRSMQNSAMEIVNRTC